MITAVLVGCGAMSAVWFEAIGKVSSLKLTGLVDLDLARAQNSATRFNLQDMTIGTSLKDVLAATKPDVVFDIAVPQARHDLVMTAFDHGCDVLTEKPMAASLEDARSIRDAAKTRGRIHAVMQNRRYISGVRRIRRFLESGALGKPTSIHCDFFLAPHFGGFREEMDHVLLLDMAIHTFDAARYMVNAVPRSVYCVEWEPAPSWYKNGSSAVAIFKMESGIVFNYRGSWCADGFRTSWESGWRIVCEQGTLVWDGFDDLRAEQNNGRREGLFDNVQAMPIPPLAAEDRVGGHLAVITEFVEAVKTRAEPETAGSDNIKSFAMVFAAIESAKSGASMTIKV